MATQAKTTSRAPAQREGANRPALPEVLSQVLDVVRDQAGCFPGRIRHARISLVLASGESLELEFAGEETMLPAAAGDERSDPGHVHEHEISGLAGFKSISDLNLGPSAKAAAEQLLEQFPDDVRFTSGRRSISEQATAMAPNIVKDRKYVEKTYKATPQRTALQKWVDDNPNATTAAAIAAGLEGVMKSWTEAQQRNFSRHITGDAFDVQPVNGPQAEKIKQAIAKLPKLNWHTFAEAGLEIWHAQFDA